MRMKAIKIVGPSDSGKTTLVEQLADRLAGRGRVCTVKHLNCAPTLDTDGTDTARHREAGAAETYGIQDDGSWFATGSGRDLADVAVDLAARCDYLLVEGYSDVALPTVALDGRAHAGESLLTAPTANAVDLDRLVAAVEGLDPIETRDAIVAATTPAPDSE